MEASGTDAAQARPHRQASNSGPTRRECTSLHRKGRLPRNFPPYKTVYHIFANWCRNGVMAGIHDRLRGFSREREDRRSRPTGAIIDSQTDRSAGLAAEAGYDASKRTKGRKRFIILDTLGHILAILVSA